MTRITKLSPAQTSRMADYVVEWTSIGLSTQPADRPRVEAAIAAMYAVAGMSPPRVVWTTSPLASGLVRASVWDSVRDSVRDSVWDSVRASVGASVWDSVGASVRASVWDSVGGHHDAGTLAFYRFFRDECGLIQQTEPLAGLWELCQSAGWALPHREICWVSERHNTLHRDARGRLHCETGPACAYPDGFGVWAWHGVRVPREWIENRAALRPETVLASKNVEQRAAGAAIVGWARMASALSRRVIDGDPDSDMGALVELTLPGLPEPGRFLMARCPRNGTVCEGVPRISDIDNLPIETALAAQSWRIGDPQSEYQHPPRRT